MNIWKFKPILIDNTWAKGEIRREIGKYFELYEINTTYENLWNVAKT